LRSSSLQIRAKGIYPEAIVERVTDWADEKQDGKKNFLRSNKQRNIQCRLTYTSMPEINKK